MNKNFIIRFLQNNKILILLFFLFSFILYANSLRNEFIVVDDLQGIVKSETIRNLGESFKTFNLQTITLSVSYALFGMTALPLRFLSIVNHAVIAVLLYILMSFIFSRKVAVISALLFLAHPVNTESLNWASAHFYIVMAIFLYSALVSHLLYRKTGNKKFLFLTAGIITLEFLLIKHAWVLIVPMAVVVADFFLIKKKFDFIFYSFFGLLLSPILFFFLFKNLFSSIEERQVSRQAITGGTLTNQQLLAPVYEGYPYSVFTLTRLYAYPKDLTLYYDGNPVSKNDLNYMRIVLILYISAIIFFLFKDKRISGLLILMLLLIAPVFAPQKITWYMTERYLYNGTGLFTTLLAVFLVYTEKKLDRKNLSVIVCAAILLLYSIRTVTRNNDWRNSETIARATIKTSPYTVRPYNDLGGYFTLQNRYNDAKKTYARALQISESSTAMKNLGYIYLKTGFDPVVQTLTIPYEEIVANGISAFQTQEYDLAAYYFNEAYARNPSDIRVLNYGGTLFAEAGNFDMANDLLFKSLEINPSEAETYYTLGYLAYKQGNKPDAITYLQQTLRLNPQHKAAQTNLDLLLNSP